MTDRIKSDAGSIADFMVDRPGQACPHCSIRVVDGRIVITDPEKWLRSQIPCPLCDDGWNAIRDLARRVSQERFERTMALLKRVNFS